MGNSNQPKFINIQNMNNYNNNNFFISQNQLNQNNGLYNNIMPEYISNTETLEYMPNKNNLIYSY